MNLLFIVPYAPTPIRCRPYNFVRCLAARGHRVVLATVWENEAERKALEGLQAQGIRVVARPLGRMDKVRNSVGALVSGQPMQSAFSWQPHLARDIDAIIMSEPLDAIHVEHVRGSRYARHARSVRQRSEVNRAAPVIWDAVDCISFLFRQTAEKSRSRAGRLMARLELRRTERLERALVREFDRVLVTSDLDRQELERLASAGAGRAAGPPPITVLPNGVDLDYFRPSDEASEPDTVVFSGKMSYHANVTAALFLADEVMPRVWERRDSVRLAIVGSAPSSQVRRLSQRAGGRITVTGYVPDLRPHLWRAGVAVAPLLYGAGVQNKVLEAMACAKPVVATPRTMAPFASAAREACLVADSPEQFAHAILSLLGDAGLRARMGRAGRAYVQSQHEWGPLAAQLEGIYGARP